MSKSVDTALAALKSIKPGWRAKSLVNFALGCTSLARPRRKVAEKNIEIVFPNASADERKQWLDECYANLAWTGAEIFGWQNDASLINGWTAETVGTEYIDEALEKGHGALFLTAHIGNWEHAAAWIGYNYGSYGIAQHNKSPFQKELISRLRATSGLKVIGKEEPMTRIISVLKKNGTVGIVSDQHTGCEGIMAPFFGIDVPTAQGLAVFSYLTGAPIIPGRSIRLAPYKFKMEFSKPIEWEKLASRDETVYDITCKCNHVLEKWIKSTPGQWLWLHKRFKDVLEYR